MAVYEIPTNKAEEGNFGAQDPLESDQPVESAGPSEKELAELEAWLALETAEPYVVSDESYDPYRVMLSHKLLTAAQEVVLAKEIEAGDVEAKKTLIEHNLRLVASLVKDRYSKFLSEEDLFQEGVIGLNRAAEKFDWRRNFRFTTYATWWILQSIDKAILNTEAAIRIPTNKHEETNGLEKAKKSLRTELGREPSFEELAARTGITIAAARVALNAVAVTASLNVKVGEKADAELGDLLESETAANPFDLVKDGIPCDEINLALFQKLDARERYVIASFFGLDGPEKTSEQISEEIDISADRVARLRQLALQKLREVPYLQAYKDDEAETVGHATSRQARFPKMGEMVNIQLPDGKTVAMPENIYEIIELVAQEYTNQQIAHKLGYGREFHIKEMLRQWLYDSTCTPGSPIQRRQMARDIVALNLTEQEEDAA